MALHPRLNRRRRHPVSTAGLTGACLALMITTAAAQPPQEPEGVTAYGPAEVAASGATTADDLLQRLPGFSVIEADADVRGYAGARGNVLIDGVRPGKREDIGSLLERIPVAAIERVELIRSGAPGIDMAGYPVVANVVRRRVTMTETQVEAGLAGSAEGWTAPLFNATYARRSGDRSLELAASYAPELDDDSGEGRIVETDDNGDVAASDINTTTIERAAEATAAYQSPFARGRLVLSGAARSADTRSDTVITYDGGTERVSEDEDYREFETSLRYAGPLGDRTALDLLLSRQWGELDARERLVDGDETESFSETAATGETIGRIEVSYEPSASLSFTAGAEGAVNLLEGRARLEQAGVTSTLPGSDVRIEERRGELFVAATWKPVETVVVEAGVRLEASTIAQTGDSGLERAFSYFKPRLSAAWQATKRDRLRLSASREVGQLDFGDFVASASLDTGQVSAGNAALEPDKTWRVEASWERSLWTDAVLTITWTHEEIGDVVDRVLVVTPTDIFDAPGNIGSGRRDTLGLDFASSLERIGFTGGRLRTAFLWRSSAVTDPATGVRRGISDESPFEGEIEISQNLPGPRLRWGVSIDGAERLTSYRFDEITREREAASWTAYVEKRLGDSWRLRIEASDLLGRTFSEDRETYDGARSTTPPGALERREHRSPGVFSLSIRRSMGG